MVRFLIGTQSLKSENSIQCIEYDEESVLISKFVYPHPSGEIWQTCAHPCKADIVGTLHSNSDPFSYHFYIITKLFSFI